MSNLGHHENLPIPHPLFSCAFSGCTEEVSYESDSLFWYAAGKKWVCENCWENLPRIGADEESELPKLGPSLEAYILASSLSAADLLQKTKHLKHETNL